MRWIVLALSLGAMIVSMIHGVLAIWQLGAGSTSTSIGTWTTNILLLVSVIIAFIGGTLAFNRRKIGGFFIIAAALICLFAHSDTRVYGWIYLVAGALAFTIRNSYEYYEEEYDDFEIEDEYDAEEEEEKEEERRGRSIFDARARKREDSQEFFYDGKRNERASRMSLDREEYSLGGESLRIRSSKVCPA